MSSTPQSADENNAQGLIAAILGSGSLSKSLAKDPMMQLPWIGFRIFKWLLLLVAVLVALISVYAWRTYPTDQQILTVLGSEASAAERLAGVAATRQAWLSSIKDLAQISIFSSVFPAITGVFGYIFGVSKQRSDGGAAGQGRGLGA